MEEGCLDLQLAHGDPLCPGTLMCKTGPAWKFNLFCLDMELFKVTVLALSPVAPEKELSPLHDKIKGWGVHLHKTLQAVANLDCV